MNKKTERVLIVEDNKVYADLLANRLSTDAKVNYKVIHVTSLAEVYAAIESERPQIMLLDLNLTDSKGLETLEAVQRLEPNFPIVILSAASDESMAIETLRRGAQDYLIKSDFKGAHLAKVLRYAHERYRICQKLREESFEDGLTGLLNRKGFYAHAHQQFKMASRQKKPLALLMVDIDDLKTINDSMGHLKGDFIIQKTGEFLRDTFRDTDLVARLGGDEFVVLAYDADRERAEQGLKRLRERLEIYNKGAKIPLSLSCGIAETGDAVKTAFIERLIEKADRELYEQKSKKENNGRHKMNKKKIVIVDDDAQLTELLCLRLESQGYEVKAFNDGEKALQDLGSEHPDLLIMDIKMPKIDGWTLVKELRKKDEFKSKPFVILTASPGMRDLFAMEGVHDYIDKPFKPEDLLAIVEKKLNTGEQVDHG